MISEDGTGCIPCGFINSTHPAKFSHAIEMALIMKRGFSSKITCPRNLLGLRISRGDIFVQKSGSLDGIRKVFLDEVKRELDENNS